jgi:hypothetical protein
MLTNIFDDCLDSPKKVMNTLKSGVVVAVKILGICEFCVNKPCCKDRGLAKVCEHSKVCLVAAKAWNFLMS